MLGDELVRIDNWRELAKQVEVNPSPPRIGVHETEDRLLHDALQTKTPTVFAAAASVVLNPSLLGGALVVWLRMSPAMEERNIARSGQRHRPLPVDAAAVLERMSAERVGLYGGIADVIVDVGEDAASTCERVLEALRALSSET